MATAIATDRTIRVVGGGISGVTAAPGAPATNDLVCSESMCRTPEEIVARPVSR